MRGLASQPPSSGGRVGLRLAEIAEAEVVYHLTLAHPRGECEGSLTIDVADGGVTLQLDCDAPTWLRDLARSLARGAWRNRERQAWPRRITRWRPDPVGAVP